MSTEQRTDDKNWYNRFYGERLGGSLVVAPEIVERYRKLLQPELFHLEKWHQLIGDVRGKKVLYVACGIETSGILLALRGAEVWVFDLAFEAIRHQRTMAIANGTAAQTHFLAGSCAHLPFDSQSFDRVIGIGIWHHLQEDLDTPCSEVNRILKEDGFAVFEEPIARSTVLPRLRKFIPIRPPAASSPECRALSGSALEHFARRFHLEEHSFGFFARLDRLVLGEAPDADAPRVPLEFASWWRKWTVLALHYIDFLLFRIPGFNRFGGSIVLKLSKPDGLRT